MALALRIRFLWSSIGCVRFGPTAKIAIIRVAVIILRAEIISGVRILIVITWITIIVVVSCTVRFIRRAGPREILNSYWTACWILVAVITLVIVAGERGAILIIWLIYAIVVIWGSILVGRILVIVAVVVLIWIRGGSFIPDISVEPSLPIGVVRYNLCPSIRKLHSIFSSNLISVARFSPFVIIPAILVFNGVAEFVRLWLKRIKI